MPTEKDNDPKVAVRCQNCNKILAFKLGTAIGFLQLKCPVCKTDTSSSAYLVFHFSLKKNKSLLFLVK